MSLLFSLLLGSAQADKFISLSSPDDSVVRHELLITPTIGYGELPYLESHLADALYYNNIHFLTASPVFGCTLDYILTSEILIGLEANYQTVPFSAVNIEQLYYYNNISAPYIFKTTPQFGCSADFLESDNTSIGLTASYQTIQWSSISAQTFYPNSLQFNCLNLGLRALYYFEGRNSSALDYYLGGRIDLSVWNEKDSWINSSNNQYIPIIISSPDNLSRPDNLQLSLSFYGGVRYFFLPALGMHAEIGFGLGSPYYAEFGIIVRLNHKH